MRNKRDISILEDEQLIKQYQSSNNIELVGILYTRYSYLIYGLCLKYLKNQEQSKDASLEIFEILVEKLKLHEVKFFKSWLYIVSKNHCLMILRKAKRIESNTTIIMEDISDESVSYLELKFLKEKKFNALEKAIDQLKDKQSTCIKLFYLEEKSYDEIAEVLQENRKSVKSSIQNGKRNLKLILENHVFEK